MGDVLHRLGQFLLDWMRTSVREVVLKAPRERPDMLVWVFLLAMAVITIYIVTALEHV